LDKGVTLSFPKLEFDYKATKPDGSPGTQKVFKWDVRQNKPF
jgi:hypothetical protein